MVEPSHGVAHGSHVPLCPSAFAPSQPILFAVATPAGPIEQGDPDLSHAAAVVADALAAPAAAK